ncbi:MAG: hypothetical protein JRE14_09295, partial [Deltaproteobacteria bacterium]|nr:hypothetical protein [Deltaproteobacteria bacterium]
MSILSEKSGLAGETYAEVYGNFRWRLPRTYNIGFDVCDKWAGNRQRVALIHVGADDVEQTITFYQLKKWS